MEQKVQQDIDSLKKTIAQIDEREDEQSKELLLYYHQQITELRRLQLEVFQMENGNIF